MKSPPSLEAIERLSHKCEFHTRASPSTTRQLRPRRPLLTRASSIPLHNQPQSGDAADQVFLPRDRSEEALHLNAQKQNVEIKKSGVPNSGRGCFARQNFKPGDVPLQLYGKFVTKERHRYLDRLIKTGRKATDLTPEEEEYVEDAKKGIWRSLDCASFLSDAKSEYVLLVSRQCPAGYINDPRSAAGSFKANCRIKWPNAPTVSKDLRMPWNEIGVVITRDITEDQEIFFAYKSYEPSGPKAALPSSGSSESSPTKPESASSNLHRRVCEMAGSPPERLHLMPFEEREAFIRDHDQKRASLIERLLHSTMSGTSLNPPAPAAVGTAVFLCMANVHKGYKTPKSQNNPSGGGGPERDRDRLEMIRRTDAR
ncbi:MAG: hypothetical protein P4M11_04460, partial [Candidatus Pacebacteria bacterium]|nr:hypothetical protein [Candidatus Paceibacterota bacterium]